MPLLEGHDNWILLMSYSPDGGRIVSYSADSIRVWDAVTGAEMLVLGPIAKCIADQVRFSSNGMNIIFIFKSMIILDGDVHAHIWDAFTGERVDQEPLDKYDTFKVSGPIVLVEECWLKDISTGRYILKLPPGHGSHFITASHGRSIAIGNASGHIMVIQCPS